MKGVILLTVEVNYEDMIQEDKLEALYGFTGIKSADELRKIHFKNLGQKLVEAVDGLPFVKFNLDGRFYPTLQVEEKKYEEESEDSLIYTKEDEIPAEVQRNLVKELEVGLEAVSLDRFGMPKLIKVNKEMMDALKKQSGLDKVTSFSGFDIIEEGMEEFAGIIYEELGSNVEGIYYIH